MKDARKILLILAASCGAALYFQVPSLAQGGEQNQSVQDEENRAQARNYFNTGLMLYKQRQYEEAEKYFRRALKKDPAHEESQKYLIQIGAVLGRSKDTVSEQAGWLERQKTVYDDELRIQLEHKIEAAKKDYELLDLQVAADPGERLKKLDQIKAAFGECLELSRALPTKLDMGTYGSVIEGYLNDISDRSLVVRQELDALQRQQARETQVRELEENERYVDNKIRSMLNAVQENMAKRQYEAAIKLADDVLVIDPLNKTAKSLKTKAEKLRHVTEEAETEDLKEQERRRKVQRIKEAGIPYAENVVYPSDWERINQRQQQGLRKKQDPEWKVQLQRAMEQKFNYNCPGLPLDQLLSALSDITGINILLDPAVRRDKTEDQLFIPAFQFTDMSFQHIMNWVARRAELKWLLQDDAIYVTSPEAQADNLVVQLYDIQDLLAPKKNFVPPDLSVGEITAGADAIDFGGEGEAAAGGEPVTGERILDLIKKAVSGRWDDENSGAQIALQAAAGSILIKNTPEVHNQIIELLETLRKTSSMMVEVEARKLKFEKDFFRDLGFDWRGLATGDKMTKGNTVEPGFTQRADLHNIKSVINNNLPSMGPNKQFGFFLEHSVLSKIQAKVIFRMLEENKTITELISPRIVLVNNINGYIRLGRKMYYISGYTAGGGGLQPEISDVDEGQLLQVRATISSDRKYITLQVQPDFQGINFREPVFITGGGTGTGTGGVPGRSLPVDLPIIFRQKVRTTAVIPDGGVLIVGGVAESRERSNTRGVPILSRIPLLGRIFRSDGRSDSTMDQMYLVHGTIIITEEIESEL